MRQKSVSNFTWNCECLPIFSSLIYGPVADQLIAAALPASDDRGILKYLLSHIAVNDKQKKEHEKPKLEALKVLQKLLDDPRLRICVAPACYRIYVSN